MAYWDISYKEKQKNPVLPEVITNKIYIKQNSRRKNCRFLTTDTKKAGIMPA